LSKARGLDLAATRPDKVLMERPVGIDAIAAYVPRLYVDLTGEWAEARAPLFTEGSVDALVGKVKGGVGVRRMAIPDAHQDCATLAAMAAKRVIDAAGIDPRDIDYVAIGTETTVDQSKSIGAYVLGMLERHYGVSMEDAGAPQLQFACIGATYALESAVSRIRARDNAKPYALVIASDIAKYPLGSPGEYTQGAGAVALLVSENPRLLVLEPGLSATITRDERDFFRPNWTSNAVVDGKYSIDVYLDCMQAAFDAYARRASQAWGSGASLYDRIDHFLFHVPFPRMAEYAALRIFSHLWLADPDGRARLARDLPGVALEPNGDARAWRKELERALAKTPLFRDAFAAKVDRSLSIARDVGNVYSGSLYLALVSLLERTRDVDLTGRRLLLGSYGSGASAKILSGVVAERYGAIVATLRTHEEMRGPDEGGPRIPVALADYERLHGLSDVEPDFGDALAQKLAAREPLTAADVTALRAALDAKSWRVRARGESLVAPRGEFAIERLGTSASAQKTDTGYRYYGWISA
jgi:hydroxymethylglutaryl-CoA synthase